METPKIRFDQIGAKVFEAYNKEDLDKDLEKFFNQFPTYQYMDLIFNVIPSPPHTEKYYALLVYKKA